MTKLKSLKCDKTIKKNIVTAVENSICDKSQKFNCDSSNSVSSDSSSSDSSNSDGNNSSSSDSSNSDIFLKTTSHLDNQWDVLGAAFPNSCNVLL